MKLLIKILALCIICSNGYASMYAQSLDFDSLYQHDIEYKQAIKSAYKSLDFFDQEGVINISIESDFKNLVKHKFKDEYQPAILRYSVSDTVTVPRKITIKPRGNMRRSTCYFPPLKLNFPKKEAVLRQIKEFDKMKMVVNCKKGETSQQYLLSEYYAYKVFNIITDVSFRVNLIEVTYIDTGEKYKSGTSYAYIIESIDQIAKRNNAIPFELKNLSDKYINQECLANIYLFQYLIGNTDWSIPAGHNINMIKSSDPLQVKPLAIPYDFDYAGIVNTNYAVPDERLGRSYREGLAHLRGDVSFNCFHTIKILINRLLSKTSFYIFVPNRSI
jgi:antitoxin component of RelBE/YafQ-DinJ toxin-antitoxin module